MPELKNSPSIIIAPVEFHGERADLIRGKGGAGNVGVAVILAVGTVKNTLVGEQDLEQGDASSVRGKCMAHAGSQTIPHVPAVSSAVDAA